MQNLLSLLRLPPEIRDYVKKEEIGVSQGYIFAANLENPGLMTLFEKHMNIMNLPQMHISIPGIA